MNQLLKQDIDLIFISLKNLSFNDSKDVKKAISLLETLSSTLISIKSSCTANLSFDFSEQILYFDHLLSGAFVLLKIDNNRTKIDNYILLELLLKNFHYFLKFTNNQEWDSYSSILENFFDYLIEVKSYLSQLNINNEKTIIVHLENISLLLLKCIYFILSRCQVSFSELNKNAVCGKFVGIVRCFLFYGLENYELNSLSISLYPSPICQFFPADLTDASPKKRKGRLDDEDITDDKMFNTQNASFSNSEYSSSELDEEIFRDFSRRQMYNKKIYSKIRMLSYESFQAALPVFGIRVMFGFWSFLFPDSPFSLKNTQFSVLTTISKDPSNRVRTSALNFMYNFFNCGKRFIRTLVNETPQSVKSTSKAFTPLSVSITIMVKELHNFFEFMLFNETNTSILILVYKVLSLIVIITPYNKLCTNILQPLFQRNAFLLDHKVTQIRNLSLALYVKIFTPDLIPKELRAWLVETKIGIETINQIFKFCYTLIENEDYILLSIESIILLTSVTKHHILMKSLFVCQPTNIDIDKLCQLSIDTIDNQRVFNNSVFQNLAGKFIHTLGMLLKHITSKDDGIFKDDSERMTFTKNWFNKIFSSKLFQMALVEQDMNIIQASTQVTLINVISLIPGEVFELFDPKSRFHIITILLSFSKTDNIFETSSSEKSDIEMIIYNKSAAVRCLSILQSFDCLSDDISLIFDLIEICLDNFTYKESKPKLQKKKEIVLLEHSLWALANICDGIKKNHLESEMNFSLLQNISSVLVKGFDLNYIQYHTDDILVNLVRCCGSVINIILFKFTNEPESVTERYSIDTFQPILVSMIKHFINLLSSKKLYKLQWNICISFSHLFSLENFTNLCLKQYSEDEEESLLRQIYNCLYHTFTQTANHKVQSYSVYTICNIHKLDYFEQFIETLWISVVEKFIKDYSTVPVHSHQSWLEKYVFSLEKLYNYLVVHTDKISILNEYACKLKCFVECEMSNQGLDDALQVQLSKLYHLLQ